MSEKKINKKEVAWELCKATFSQLVPGGPYLTGLMDYALNTHTKEAFESLLDQMKKQIDDLKDKVEVESLNKDEFSELFKSCILITARTHQEKKIKAASALLVNFLLKDGEPEKLNYTEVDHFIRCVEKLSMGAIQVLGVAFELASRHEPENIEERLSRMNFGDLHQKMDLEDHLLMGLLSELNSFNFIHLLGTPAIGEKNYINYPVQLTPIGARFVKRLLKP
jgi:hypothetical protein